MNRALTNTVKSESATASNHILDISNTKHSHETVFLGFSGIPDIETLLNLTPFAFEETDPWLIWV